MHVWFQSVDALLTRQPCLPFFLLTLISLTFSDNWCLQVTKFKGAAVYRVKAPFCLYLLVPEFDSEHPREVEVRGPWILSSRSFRMSRVSGIAPQKQTYWTKQMVWRVPSKLGTNALGEQLEYFQILERKKNHGRLHGRGAVWLVIWSTKCA